MFHKVDTKTQGLVGAVSLRSTHRGKMTESLQPLDAQNRVSGNEYSEITGGRATSTWSDLEVST